MDPDNASISTPESNVLCSVSNGIVPPVIPNFNIGCQVTQVYIK